MALFILVSVVLYDFISRDKSYKVNVFALYSIDKNVPLFLSNEIVNVYSWLSSKYNTLDFVKLILILLSKNVIVLSIENLHYF